MKQVDFLLSALWANQPARRFFVLPFFIFVTIIKTIMVAEKHQFNLPEFEEKILKFWEEKHIFERTLAAGMQLLGIDAPGEM